MIRAPSRHTAHAAQSNLAGAAAVVNLLPCVRKLYAAGTRVTLLLAGVVTWGGSSAGRQQGTGRYGRRAGGGSGGWQRRRQWSSTCLACYLSCHCRVCAKSEQISNRTPLRWRNCLAPGASLLSVGGHGRARRILQSAQHLFHVPLGVQLRLLWPSSRLSQLLAQRLLHQVDVHLQTDGPQP